MRGAPPQNLSTRKHLEHWEKNIESGQEQITQANCRKTEHQPKIKYEGWVTAFFELCSTLLNQSVESELSSLGNVISYPYESAYQNPYQKPYQNPY